MTQAVSAGPWATRGENERKVFQRDPNPHLFRPLQLRSVTAKNRIVMSPMCQYSAIDGVANDWHLVNLASRAVGGVGIVFTEVAHVEARGRITPHCLGIWNDAQRDALQRIVAAIATQGAVPAIQIGHAGRKASTARPWDGGKAIAPGQGGWECIAPSAIAFGDGYPIPNAMDHRAIAATIELFRASARRAREAGFRLLEVHAAHGYLLHEFLSPLANARNDEYGGSFDNRIRMLLQTIDAVRTEWPDELPLFVRISATDWVEGGWDLEQSVRLAEVLKSHGKVDVIDCSSGAMSPQQQIRIHPGYQVPFAEAIRRRSGMPTGAVGLIHSPDMAEQILANAQADLIFLGRTLLAEPYWPLRAAKQLRAKVPWPVQYERADIF
ncbi:MAG: NADH:flavin oxidoreductase/NADH oxidase [Burkholderiales bacterium]|nr:NADH:flavin oxidoreductase/NADH oxidase [Burkholderiales bacterium]